MSNTFSLKKKILIVAGARPNFIKITQFEKQFALYPDRFEFKILHTGQHYDKNMSDVFFEALKLKTPEFFLEVKGQTPSQQIGNIIIGMEPVLQDLQPDLVIVVGDVNSTLAAAVATDRQQIKLAHVESGLRSFDRTMPEEINRIVADALADIFFITEESGRVNLLNEGKSEDQIHLVGNTMIDTLVAFQEEISNSDILDKLNVQKNNYALLTIHRPSNVDDKDSLTKVLDLIDKVTERMPAIFPVHPRTTNRFKEFGLTDRVEKNTKLTITEPLDYFSFQKLIAESQVVITDSGGIQEETSFKHVPCLTLRDTTERPSTLDLGTSTLISYDLDVIDKILKEIVAGKYKKGEDLPFWDGKATGRIVEVLLDIL